MERTQNWRIIRDSSHHLISMYKSRDPIRLNKCEQTKTKLMKINVAATCISVYACRGHVYHTGLSACLFACRVKCGKEVGGRMVRNVTQRQRSNVLCYFQCKMSLFPPQRKRKKYLSTHNHPPGVILVGGGYEAIFFWKCPTNYEL